MDETNSNTEKRRGTFSYSFGEGEGLQTLGNVQLRGSEKLFSGINSYGSILYSLGYYFSFIPTLDKLLKRHFAIFICISIIKKMFQLRPVKRKDNIHQERKDSLDLLHYLPIQFLSPSPPIGEGAFIEADNLVNNLQ